MVSVRERIRINGNPLSEEVFAKYFFEVWDALDANTKARYFCPSSIQYIN
jgi:folylpolyglutamate synthase